MMDVRMLSDAQVLGLTGAAEARSYLDPARGWRPAPLANMVAVMCTVLNRVEANPKRFGETVTDACLKPRAYSCWNLGSGENHDWLAEQAGALLKGAYVAPTVQQCVAVAAQLLDHEIADTVRGATHYYSPVSMIPTGRVPDWAVGQIPIATVGDHLFFINV